MPPEHQDVESELSENESEVSQSFDYPETDSEIDKHDRHVPLNTDDLADEVLVNIRNR